MAYDTSDPDRFNPVQIETVYQVSCRICQKGAVDGEVYDEYGDAEDARDFHRKEHKERTEG